MERVALLLVSHESVGAAPGAIEVNYYEHHIGDYAEATAHLSFVEDAAYSRCIRKYYASEAPLPADVKAVQRLVGARSRDEKAAVDTILREFFTLTEDGWHNARCDEEIARYQDKRSSAKRSANTRWNSMRSHSDGNANASETHIECIAKALPPQSDGNALQSPIPSLQSPIPSKTQSRSQALADARAVQGVNLAAFDRWIGYRNERKPAVKTISLVAAAQQLAKFGDDDAQAATVQFSIANGYQGLVAPKPNGNGQTSARDKLTWRPTEEEDRVPE